MANITVKYSGVTKVMAQPGQNMPAARAGGATGGAWQQNPPIRTLEELATSSATFRGEAEIVLKYKDVVKQTLRNAVRRTRSCVLRYEHIYEEIHNIIEDEDEAWEVENAAYAVLNDVKIDDIVVYKIYVNEDSSENDVLVVLFGEELTEREVEILKKVASLFDTKFYDVFDEEDGQFYDATPLSAHERNEVYTVLHNLVMKWTSCFDVIEELEKEEEP
jgi:hypothetical protein